MEDRDATVTFVPMNVTVQARAGDTLLDAALDHGIAIPCECGGNCACTTCRVLVEEGAERLSAMEAPEDERLDTAEDRTPGMRLGCQALLRGGPVRVRIVEPGAAPPADQKGAGTGTKPEPRSPSM